MRVSDSNSASSVSSASSDRTLESSASSRSDISIVTPSHILDSSSNFLASLLHGPLLEVNIGKSPRTQVWPVHLRLFAHHSEVVADQFRRFLRDGDPKDSTNTGEDADLYETDQTQYDDGVCSTPQSDLPEGEAPATPTHEAPHSTRARMSLPDTTSMAFAQLLKFIYQGSIDSLSSLSLTPASGIAVTTAHQEVLWEHAMMSQDLYLLAVHLKIEPLQDLAISSFRQACYASALVPGAEEMLPIYERTPPRSPMRRLCAQIAARQFFDPDLTPSAARDTAESYRDVFSAHIDFTLDVMEAIRRGTGGKLLKDPTSGQGCNEWHVHESQRCPATRSAISKKKVTFNT